MLNCNELKDGKTNTAFSETHPSLIVNLLKAPREWFDLSGIWQACGYSKI